MSSLPASRRVGRYGHCQAPQEAYRAYVPPDLPPEPPIDMLRLLPLLEQANQAIGRWDGIFSVLPDPGLFLYMYVRKEAVLSSQIEGIQSSLSDLLIHEGQGVSGAPLNDVQEVSRYVAAMSHGLDRLHSFPLSLRLLREIHEKLMRGGRGGERTPGEFRITQNWIGGTRPGNAAFVPPPPHELMNCLDHFEKFMHKEDPALPILVKAAMLHVQFETIHPFLDGNGRLGRLLITFFLCANDVLRQPTLYLSLYLKRNRQQYYDLLQQVRLQGAWEEWIDFFLQGVIETATQAVETARSVTALLASDRAKVEALGRPASSALRVFHHLRRHPIISIAPAATALEMSFPTAAKSIQHLERVGILREHTGKQRDRWFTYQAYLDILSQGTEPLPRQRCSAGFKRSSG